MCFYVRKINFAKFPKDPLSYNNEIENISADAVSDLGTKSNELSVWRIPTDSKEDIDEAVLALVTSSKQNHFEKIDFVVFSDEILDEHNLKITPQIGDTAVDDLKNEHKNISELTYGTLKNVLKIITDKTCTNEQIRRTKSEVENIITNNLARINMDFINPNLKKKIDQLIG